MARRGWRNPPPVMLLSGSEEFLRLREYRKALLAAGVTKRRIDFVDGEDKKGLADALFGGFLFDDSKILVVVTNPTKADLSVIESHQEEVTSPISLLLHHEGKLPVSTLLAKSSIPKTARIAFDKPDKPHKVVDAAIRFIVQEAKSRGMKINTDLAESLIKRVGSDYGILHFEILKAATLAAALGVEAIEVSHLKATMVQTGEADIAPLVDALGAARLSQVLREMDNLKRNFTGPEGQRTLAVCGWIGKAAIRWLHVEVLASQGSGEDEIASRVGIHPYIYKRFLLPVSTRWGRRYLIRLIKRVSKVEMAVSTGHLSPWVELETGLVALCRAVEARG